MADETFGSRLRRLRKAAGIEQQDAARRLGVSRQTVASWERGRTSPRAVNLSRLAAIYGCAVADLLGGTRVTEGARWMGPC